MGADGVRAIAVALLVALRVWSQDSKPTAVDRLLAVVVSDDAAVREEGLREFHQRGDLAVEAATKVAAALAPPRTEKWPRYARAASALILGARARVDSHVSEGGTESDTAGTLLAQTRTSVSALLLPPIRGALDDPQRVVRAEAIRDIGSFARDASDLVPRLAKVVADPAEDVATRTNAATALRRMRGLARGALKDLAEALEPKAGAFTIEVAGAIADVLNGLALSASKDGKEAAGTKVQLSEEEWDALKRDYAPTVVGELAQVVRGDDAVACWYAAVALGWLGDEGAGATGDLLAAAAVREGEALLNVLWAIMQFRWVELPPTALPTLLRALEIGPDGAREHAAWLLVGLARKKIDVSKAGDVLLRHAGSADRGLSRAALHALESMEAAAKPWAAGLGELLHRNAPDEAKADVVSALVAVDPARLDDVPLLARLLGAKDFWTRRTAMRAIVASGRLDASLEDAVILAARENAERWGQGGCARDLADVAAGLKPSEKLASAFLTLARSGEGGPDPKWVPVLRGTGVAQATLVQVIEESLKSPFHYQDARESLRQAPLAGLEGDRLIRFYTDHLRSTNKDVYSATVDVLKELGPKGLTAIPALWEAQLAEFSRADAASRDSGDRFPGTSALFAIESIGGRAMVPRLHEEIGRASGESRRVLFGFASSLDPESEQTAAELRVLLASKDPEDRSKAIYALDSLPSFPRRIETLEEIVGRGGDDGAKAGMVLMEVAPQSPAVAKVRLASLESGDAQRMAEALPFFERSNQQPPAFEASRMSLLGSEDVWAYETALASFDRRRPAGAPSQDDLAAFARGAKTRGDRLLAAWSAGHGGVAPAAFFDVAAPWLEWKDPNLALLLLDAASRNAARADAIVAQLPALIGGGPPAPRKSEQEPSRWDGELLGALKVAIARFGPRAAAAASALQTVMSKDESGVIWLRRAVDATAAVPRRRAEVKLSQAAAPHETAWGLGSAATSRPAPHAAALPDGSHRFIVDDGGAKAGTWIEMYLDVGRSGAPVWEVAVNRFTESPPAVRAVAVDAAEITLVSPQGPDWTAAPTLSGAFTVRCGSETLTGSFSVANPLAPVRPPEGGKR
jgi:hypothetical protein